MDDLVVYGDDLLEHDANLHIVLTRLQEKGLTVNGDKLQFRLPKLTFSRHKLSAQGVVPSGLMSNAGNLSSMENPIGQVLRWI